MTIKSTDLRVQKAIVLYKSGKGIKAIRDELRMDEVVIKKFLKQEGILLTQSQVVQRNKLKGGSVNHEALDVLTPDALYWIGFLYAEGHIEKDRPRISLTISEIDINHLEKFSKFFGKGLTVRKVEDRVMKSNGYVSNPTYRVAFSSERIYNRLKELGFTHLKTYESIPNEVCKYSRDFWRGMIDGDGCIYHMKGAIPKYDKAALNLSGNKETINTFLNYITSLGISYDATNLGSKRSKVLFQTTLSANKVVINTLEVLYKNSSVYLERKYKKYLEMIEKYKKPTT